jgi:hypothetical protein
MPAIAPPMRQAEPIIPADVNAPAPVETIDIQPSVSNAGINSAAINAEPQFKSPIPTPVMDMNALYEDAASSGNPASMYSLSSKLKGTPMEQPIKKIATEMQQRVSDFEEKIKPISDAGGVNTPQGRLAASKTFESMGDKPDKWRAFVELLMGNPKWRTFVTGGTPTTSIVYDKEGNQLEKTINEVGQIISIKDTMGRSLTRNELTERGGLVPSLQDALGYQQQKENLKTWTEKNNIQTETANAYAAKAPELALLNKEMQQRFQTLWGAGLTNEQRNLIGQFTSRTAGMSTSMSNSFSDLNQYLDSKQKNLSAAQTRALQSGIEKSGILGKLGWSFGSSGQLVNKNGESVSKQDLTQAQEQFSNSQGFEKNYTQAKEDFLRNEVFTNLGEAEKKNLGRILDLQGQIEKANLELVSKHGSLAFTINPQSYQIGDEFSRGIASSLIGEFNATASEMFQKWREEQLSRYPKTLAPKPGELEAAFVKTPAYKNLREEFSKKNTEVLTRVGESMPPEQQRKTTWEERTGTAEAKSTEKPAKPTERSIKSRESVPKNYTPIGTTPNGKTIYKTPKGGMVTQE